MDNLRRRKQLRLKDYDYSQAGYYFITICTKDRLNLFGKIVGADDPVRLPVMDLNEIGQIVCECWGKTNEIYNNVKTDSYCIMPNHIHGIILIGEAGGQSHPPLQKIIKGFKSVTT